MKGGAGSFDATDVMRRRLTITGSTLRNRDVLFKAQLTSAVEEKVWPLIQQGKFKPVIYKTFPFQQAAAAHTLMESSEHIGKIVLIMD
jgi:NADPH:quinone reductase-like Zn-dependent oxidoreductase